ncbi:hypothetical protein [Caldilinea sp.]|jgi:hypothetical protein|uniref:hypothetical protein n=1 Tax=Caldilinea sp. TaxID=2293560 RepID=UPI0026290A19|nr:hypothetical protein [Caldilinea sp.]
MNRHQTLRKIGFQECMVCSSVTPLRRRQPFRKLDGISQEILTTKKRSYPLRFFEFPKTLRCIEHVRLEAAPPAFP